MKASKYIEYLQGLIAEHGDLEIVNADEEPLDAPEYNADTGVAVFYVDLSVR